MLFNTSEFVFLFLPLAVTLHFWTASRNLTAAAIVTTLSSLAFYAWSHFSCSFFLAAHFVDFTQFYACSRDRHDARARRAFADAARGGD